MFPSLHRSTEGERGARPWLPTLCAVCHDFGARRLCGRCTLRFAEKVHRCVRCALRLPSTQATTCGACLRAPPAYDGATAAVDYAYPWDGLVTRFKFHQALDLAPALARLVIDAVQRNADGSSAPPDCLLPIPLATERLAARGYNQAWELARRIAPALGHAVDARLLLRVKHTPHQLALPPERRTANVRNAFAVEPRRLAEVRGRRYALVDDVMTSGATVAEAARVLRAAGAADVQVWVVARTPSARTR